eukprot:NODE_1666_length_564_cov_262.981859_g1652_i0.p1 GENE.NODE_1666_length_564_cov_262.981859_g1652_i0~~NODE_1666_length_564_cov_262.981859_g1652_i0.p1  ORF type:complete len:145 (-),score=22.33 NODE_1666_length_564_cov_262.981859_g1652_i0:130-564(-)
MCRRDRYQRRVHGGFRVFALILPHVVMDQGRAADAAQTLVETAEERYADAVSSLPIRQKEDASAAVDESVAAAAQSVIKRFNAVADMLTALRGRCPAAEAAAGSFWTPTTTDYLRQWRTVLPQRVPASSQREALLAKLEQLLRL